MFAALVLVLSCGPGAPEGPVPGYRVASAEVTTGLWTNRLVGESSPYLLQHAHNPVDWYPWGDEAFAAAKERQVPVFLSIGYAACHWCHVMEEESFEDPKVAAVLNDWFVPVKVDREERPDVDEVYMDAVVAFQGGGGWPASLWLTPEGVPFFAGTYFPPEPRFGRPGFPQVLEEVHDRWTSDPGEVARIAADIHDALEKRARIEADSQYPTDAPTHGVAQLDRRWDPEHAGWGAKKFPMVPSLEFLLAYGVAHQDAHALDRVRAALDAMDRGGIHDHLAGGFHRYTVDRAWVVPHFEKMTDDNAQLLRIYAEAAVALDAPRYAEVARAVAGYLVREMRSADGAFVSSQDADAGGVEGASYTWTTHQVRAVLPEPEAFLAAYGVTERGNFEGTNVLTRPDADASDPSLVAARAALLEARAARTQPATDTKRVVATNGLVIGALARAGRLLDEPEWTAHAREAAATVLASQGADGALPRTLAPGSPAGVIDDYAWLAEGLLDLYEADPDPRWLLAADRVAVAMVDRFLGDNGAFFTADRHVDDLIVRKQEATDGARPSGAGRAVAVLWRLRGYGAPSGDAAVLQRALQAYGRVLRRTPGSAPSLLVVVDGLSRAQVQAVVATDGSPVAAFVDGYDAAYRPHAVSAVIDPGRAVDLAPFTLLGGKVAGVDGVLGYVCFDGVCEQPTADPHRFREALDRAGSVPPSRGLDVP